MPLTPGDKIGPYEIVAPLGAGGMGEVYRARDSKLKREVAIKVLPADVASDRERLARFQREAEVLASLNHPHIAHVYGIEENALVMELVEGEDLSQRIARGPIPIDEALPIARQIAEALEAAHDAGIVHRDLKPANVKVRPDGTVKVLDFGLAKAMDSGPGSREPGTDLANSPTITSPAMTMRGVVLGTAAYMAPEQAKGKAVDRRADIWAFGCVLYEMLAGQRTFAGEDVSDTLVSILRDDPRWSALPADTPPHVRLLLRRCLQRDPQKRLPHIGAARLDLANDDAGELAKAAPPPTASRWRIAAGVVAGAVAAALSIYMLRPAVQTGAGQLVRFTIDAPEGYVFPGANNVPRFAVSPDGRYVAVQMQNEKQSQLWIRALESLEQQQVSGTASDRGGLGTQHPFWSPDGKFLAFFDEPRGQLKKLERASGLLQVVCTVAGNQVSGSWNDDNIIVLASVGTKGVLKVAAGGGTPSNVTSIDAAAGESAHLWPDFLPDGRHFVYQVLYSNDTSPAVFLGSLDGTPPVRILSTLSMARVMPPDRLLFARGGALVSQRIDVRQAALVGEPELVSNTIQITPSGRMGVSASRTGVLVYSTGGIEGDPFETSWLDRSGAIVKDAPPTVTVRGVNGVRLSPDGRNLIFARGPTGGSTDLRDSHVWIQDLIRGIETRLSPIPTLNGAAAVYAPDGGEVVFRRSENGNATDFLLQRSSGNVAPRVLFTGLPSEAIWPIDWTPDGQQIIFYRGIRNVEQPGLWILNVRGDRAPTLYSRVTARFGAALSPDGRFLATAEGGELDASQIFVQPFPDPRAGKWTVSAARGTYPRWSRDGKEIFFVDDNRRVMAASFTSNPRVEIGSARPLFSVDSGPSSVAAAWTNPFDVMPDGKRFVVMKPRGTPTTRPQLVVAVGPR